MRGQVGDRPLNLPHQLQERGHHSESDRAVEDSEKSPEESHSVASGETDLHEASGHRIEIQALDGLLLKMVLNSGHLRDDIADSEKSQDQNPVLKVFLDQLLNQGIIGSDLRGQLTYLLEIQL